MQPPGKHPLYESARLSDASGAEAGLTRAPSSAVNALMGRLGLARTQDEPGSDEATLTANLSDPSWAVRVSAVQKLGKMGKQAPLGPLLAALRDEQHSVRIAAARALSRNPRQAAISALVAALEDSEWPVRAEVTLALGAMGEQAPLEPLLAALQDSDATVRASAAKALGEMSSALALYPLNAALQDEDWSVREAATQALTQLELETGLAIATFPAGGTSEPPHAVVVSRLYHSPGVLQTNAFEGKQERGPQELVHSLWAAHATQAAWQTNEQVSSPQVREKRKWNLDPAARKWPFKALHTAEGVLAAVIITGLFVAWLGLETQPRSSQGQSPISNSRSITFTTYHGHESQVEKLAWSPDGQTIASSDSLGDVRLWQASSGRTLVDYPQHKHVLALTWLDPTTVLAAYAEPNNALAVRQLPVSQDLPASLIFQRNNLPGEPGRAAWSSNPATLAFDTGEGSIEVWNVLNDRQLSSFQDREAHYAEIAWAPDNYQLAALSTAGLLNIWSVGSGRLINTLTYNHLVTTFAWIACGHYPSGQILVDSNNTLSNWSYGQSGPGTTAMFLTVQTYNVANTHDLVVTTLSISPDKSQVLLATSDGQIQARDLHGRSLIYLYSGHSEQVNAIEWSPNGQHIATASKDTTVRVWQEP